MRTAWPTSFRVEFPCLVRSMGSLFLSGLGGCRTLSAVRGEIFDLFEPVVTNKFELPKVVIDKINLVSSKLGFVLKQTSLAATTKFKDCCKDGKLIENGQIEEQGSITFKIWGKEVPVPGWATPTQHREHDFRVIIITIDI